MYRQPCRFIICVKGAVSVSQTGIAKTPRGIGNQLPDGALLRGVRCGARHLNIN